MSRQSQPKIFYHVLLHRKDSGLEQYGFRGRITWGEHTAYKHADRIQLEMDFRNPEYDRYSRVEVRPI